MLLIFCRAEPKGFVGEHVCVSEKIGFRKNIRIIRGLDYLLMISVCFTVPKNFVDQPFCVSEIFWYHKTLWIKDERVVSRFFVKDFVSKYREFSKGIPSVFQKKIEYRKILGKRRGYQFFVLLIFCPAESKYFVGEHVCVSENFGIEKFFG